MALDTFAKRLGTQLRPSPGDIGDADRWAIAGRTRPTPYFMGAIVAALGALTGGLVGVAEQAQPSEIRFADRMRMQMRPLGSHELVENRYAIGGRFLRQKFEEPTPDRTGAISASLGALTASLAGTFTAIETRTGAISATLGGLTAEFVGESYYRLFFDVTWSSVPTFEFEELPTRSGAISATLGELVSSFRGTALPPDSSTGFVSATLGELQASFAGTFEPPPTRTGLVHGDLGALRLRMRGAAVPPQSSVGSIQASLGPLTASLRGEFLPWTTDGHIDSQLGGLTSALFGQFVAADAIFGQVRGRLGGLEASFRGFSTAAGTGYLTGTVRVVSTIDGEVRVMAALSGEPVISPKS